jgi:outer membrane biosynthesis protein TonB
LGFKAVTEEKKDIDDDGDLTAEKSQASPEDKFIEEDSNGSSKVQSKDELDDLFAIDPTEFDEDIDEYDCANQDEICSDQPNDARKSVSDANSKSGQSNFNDKVPDLAQPNAQPAKTPQPNAQPAKTPQPNAQPPKTLQPNAQPPKTPQPNAQPPKTLPPNAQPTKTPQPANSPHGTRATSSRAGDARDSSFVAEFYSNSRLHHISTAGAEFKAYVGKLRAQNNVEFPGRDKLQRLAAERRREADDEGEEAEGEDDTETRPNSASIQRVIMHVDMDCFFVSVGLRNHPHLKGKYMSSERHKG